MKSVFRRHLFMTAVAVLIVASASFAGTTMSLTGLGDGASLSSSTYGFNVYVDPYTGSIAGGPSNVPVICDDWSDNSYVGTTWNVNVGSIGSGGLSGTPLFGTPGPAQTNLYQQIAYLSTLLLQNNGNPDMQAGISFAIWQLTYPYNNPQDNPSPINFLNSSGDQNAINDYNWANNQLANAIATNSLGGAYSFEILTPNPLHASQEFLVQTPEASTIVMFGAALLGLLTMAFFFRRDALQPVS